MLFFLFFILYFEADFFSTLSLEHQNSLEARGLGKHSAASLLVYIASSLYPSY